MYMERLTNTVGRRRPWVMTPKWWITGLATICVTGFSDVAAGAPTCNKPAVLHLVGVRHSLSKFSVEYAWCPGQFVVELNRHAIDSSTSGILTTLVRSRFRTRGMVPTSPGYSPI